MCILLVFLCSRLRLQLQAGLLHGRRLSTYKCKWSRSGLSTECVPMLNQLETTKSLNFTMVNYFSCMTVKCQSPWKNLTVSEFPVSATLGHALPAARRERLLGVDIRRFSSNSKMRRFSCHYGNEKKRVDKSNRRRPSGNTRLTTCWNNVESVLYLCLQ